MFKLFYPDETGDFVGTFDTQQECYDKAAADGKVSFTIQMLVDGVVVMVVSC